MTSIWPKISFSKEHDFSYSEFLWSPKWPFFCIQNSTSFAIYNDSWSLEGSLWYIVWVWISIPLLYTTKIHKPFNNINQVILSDSYCLSCNQWCIHSKQAFLLITISIAYGRYLIDHHKYQNVLLHLCWPTTIANDALSEMLNI